ERIEHIGRGADRAARGQLVLPDPRIGAARINADRQILDEGRRFRRSSQLLVEQPLDPLMVSEAARLLFGGAADRGLVGAAPFGRPLSPIAAMPLGQAAKGREFFE